MPPFKLSRFRLNILAVMFELTLDAYYIRALRWQSAIGPGGVHSD
jgi:hypothetical protein